MHGGGYLAQTWGCVLESCWKTLIAIKNLGFIRGRANRGGELRRLRKVIIDTDPKNFFQVGAQLPTLEKQALIEFLRDNVDVFSWDACEAPGIYPDFIYYHLNVNLSIIPRKQPPRRSSKDHYEAIKEEVTKLKRVEAIKEVFYPEWLANTVVVKKKNGK